MFQWRAGFTDLNVRRQRLYNSLPAATVSVDVDHDLQQPRSKGRFAPVAAPTPQHSAQRFLHHFFRRIGISR
jgi:hypothetical protein